MNFFLLIILTFMTSCSWTLSPEKIAVLYMHNRYFNPPYAFSMIKPGQISKKDFLLKHEEMLRIKDYNLESLIKFRAIKTIKTNTKVKVTVETMRPDIKKIFNIFHQEKIQAGWTKGQIKKEMMQRLKDPSAPQEKLLDIIELEKTKKGWRIILQD